MHSKVNWKKKLNETPIMNELWWKSDIYKKWWSKNTQTHIYYKTRQCKQIKQKVWKPITKKII